MTFVFFIYNILFIPLFFILVHIAVLFNDKIRRGIIGRKNLFKNLYDQLLAVKSAKQRIWLHIASMGEFEQGKPVIDELLERFPEALIVLSIFSPSAFENIKIKHPRIVITYMPMDTWFNVNRFLNLVDPGVAIIIRHDIWPNYLWQLKKRGIPSFLIDASITDKNKAVYKRFRGPIRSVMTAFTKILTVSEKSTERFEMLYPSKENIHTFGDTRYDRVVQRSKELEKIQWLIDKQFFNYEKTGIIGSTWPSDVRLWVPATAVLLRADPDFRFILAPHDPSKERLDHIEGLLIENKIQFVRLSALEENPDLEFKYLVIDRIGLLANLYALGLLAYVGGGFSPGVHNVLEPAAHGSAVVFGPRNIVSVEPKFLLDAQGGIVIQGEQDLENLLDDFKNDPQKLYDIGSNARDFIIRNTGASEKISKLVNSYF